MKYGLIGDGRLGRHLDHYLRLLSIPCVHWSRNLERSTQLSWRDSLSSCPTILLAISDGAIEPLAREIRETPGFEKKTLVHFSGAVQTPLAWGFHPLMSFASAYYPRSIYEQVPFIGEVGAPSFRKIFPDLPNPSAQVSPEKKALYHAWCVMGGNFTAFLWGRMFESFARDLGLSPEIALPYLKQVSENLLANPRDPRTAWTGPLVRGDQKTLETHLEALANDPYQNVYKAFIETFEEAKA